ncbi:hypothetical protein ARSEF4850_002070 [Beauveria asiatica]
MSYNQPELRILSVEHSNHHTKALDWFRSRNYVCDGVKVQVEYCNYWEAPEKLNTGVPTITCTADEGREKDFLSLILNEDKPNQMTEEGRKPASLSQSATATYEIIGGNSGNADFILRNNKGSIEKRTYNDKVVKLEPRLKPILEAAQRSNSVIIHASSGSVELVFELVKRLAEGMSPALVLRPEEFFYAEYAPRGVPFDDSERPSMVEGLKCACPPGMRVCAISTENESEAKFIEDVLRSKVENARFLKVKTEETRGAQSYNYSCSSSALSRDWQALQAACPAQASGQASECDAISVGIVSSVWYFGTLTPVAVDVVSLRGGGSVFPSFTSSVRFQPAFLYRASKFGFNDEHNEWGKVMLGAVMAAHTGCSADNWQRDIAKVDRYALVHRALDSVIEEFQDKRVPVEKN